jgi:hypothetical protein
MPAFTPSTPTLAVDPGNLWIAPLGTAHIANTVAGSIFTVAWSTVPAWIPVGVTEEGHVFNFQTSTEPVTGAEIIDPLLWKTSGRTGSVAFAVMSVTANMIKRAFNGGTLTPTGSGATTLTTFAPPATGAEVRLMVGWESTDATERLYFNQCFNTGQVSIARRKGADNANISMEFSLEQPATGNIFDYEAAGVARAGV